MASSVHVLSMAASQLDTVFCVDYERWSCKNKILTRWLTTTSSTDAVEAVDEGVVKWEPFSLTWILRGNSWILLQWSKSWASKNVLFLLGDSQDMAGQEMGKQPIVASAATGLFQVWSWLPGVIKTKNSLSWLCFLGSSGNRCHVAAPEHRLEFIFSFYEMIAFQHRCQQGPGKVLPLADGKNPLRIKG